MTDVERSSEYDHGLEKLREYDTDWMIRSPTAIVTAYIPSKSSHPEFAKAFNSELPTTLRETWMARTMAVFARHFGGCTSIGGDHYGLYVPEQPHDPELEVSSIVQAHAAIEEINTPGVLEELGSLMFGMAHELKQFETLLVVGGARYRFYNPDRASEELKAKHKFGSPTMEDLLADRAVAGSVADWGFVKAARAGDVAIQLDKLLRKASAAPLDTATKVPS